MPKKLKICAAGTVAVLAAAASLATTANAPVAQASTGACGSSCTTPSNQAAGSGLALTISLSGGSGSTCATVTAAALDSGQCTVAVSLAAASTVNPGQDWDVLQENTVDYAAQYGIVSNRLDWEYDTDYVVEFEAVPNGVASDQCLAQVGSTTTLQECGSAVDQQTSANTGTDSSKSSGSNTCAGNPAPPSCTGTTAIGSAGAGSDTTSGSSTSSTSIYSTTAWILDKNDASNGYVDVISGTDQQYSDPTVLTATANGSSATLGLSPLSVFNGVVLPTQMWSFSYGGQSAQAVQHQSRQHT